MPYCFAESPSCFCSKVQNWFFVNKKKQIFRRLISPIFFSPHVDWWFDTPDWRILEEGQGNYSNSKNDNRKTKLLWKRNHFPQNISLEARFLVVKTLKKTFSILKPYFFHLKVRTSLEFNFEKTVFPQNFLKVRSL